MKKRGWHVPRSVDLGGRDVSSTLTPKKWLAYRYLRWILRFDHDPRQNDGSCMSGGWRLGAVATTSVRESGSIVKYDVRGTFASGRFLGVCNPYGCADSCFQEVVVSGMKKVTFCLRAGAGFGVGV